MLRRDTATACIIMAHLAFICKNMTADVLSFQKVSTLLVAQCFLTNYYAWDVDVTDGRTSASSTTSLALLIPQTELIQIFQKHRHGIIRRHKTSTF